MAKPAGKPGGPDDTRKIAVSVTGAGATGEHTVEVADGAPAEHMSLDDLLDEIESALEESALIQEAGVALNKPSVTIVSEGPKLGPEEAPGRRRRRRRRSGPAPTTS